MNMNDKWIETKVSKILIHICLFIAVLLIVLLSLMFFCSGCLPNFAKDHIEASGIFGGMLRNDERLPTDTRETGGAMQDSADAASDKIGTSGKSINKDNLKKRFKESKAEAEAYRPWWSHLLGGLPLGGYGEGSILAMLLMFLFKKQIRSVGHFFTHNGPQKEEKV